MSKAYETEHGIIHVRGNGHERDVIYWYDLTPAEQEEFDYLGEDEVDWSSFFRYRGEVYSMDSVEVSYGMVTELGYHGVITEGAFSALLVRYNVEQGTVVVASAHW